MNMESTCLSYSNRFVFLFLGGFLIALAMEKWQLHRRIAMMVVRATGTSANRIILGFLLATYFISMWISNTATTLMMFPIVTSVLTLLVKENRDKSHRHFSTALMLSIAYGASIGGIATLVGSPPNASIAGIMSKSFNIEISFIEWMKWGLPFSFLLLMGVYIVLVHVLFPNRLGTFPLGKEVIESEYRSLGRMSVAEKRVFILFILAAVLWITQSPLAAMLKQLGAEWSDTTIALLIGCLMFVVPSGQGKAMLDWRDTERLPWGILLMFGGGMSLAAGFETSGLIDVITAAFSQMQDVSPFYIMMWMCLSGLILTALLSNIAMVNAFVPIVAATAVGLGIDPVACVIPVTMAASCDFMFPMSTPPNAIVYSSGYIRSADMLKGGLLLNVLSFMLLLGLIWMIT
jgi:sodium-dependent dicarboxylate transporter 2/3/5